MSDKKLEQYLRDVRARHDWDHGIPSWQEQQSAEKRMNRTIKYLEVAGWLLAWGLVGWWYWPR